MENRDILMDLIDVNMILSEVRKKLLKSNSEGKQFDYTTSSRLSEVVDKLNKTNEDINNIVYQKN